MTQAYVMNDLPCRNAADRILTRKAELDAFFHEDWARLRTLILSLEEELWDGTGRSSPAADRAAADRAVADRAVADRAVDQALLETSTEFRLPSPENVGERSPLMETCSPQERVAADRLSELASQIERRIKIVSAGRR